MNKITEFILMTLTLSLWFFPTYFYGYMWFCAFAIGWLLSGIIHKKENEEDNQK